MPDGDTGVAAHQAERRDELSSLLGRLLSQRADGREDDLAGLREEAVQLAERFREAGEERIADQLLVLIRSRPSRGRRQEWNALDHALLSAAVFLLMEREGITARGACERLADPRIDRSWFLVFDKVVAARHRPTVHALYEQFRLWLRSQGSSIMELNRLRQGGTIPVESLPPHLATALAETKAWLEWLPMIIPTIKSPRAKAIEAAAPPEAAKVTRRSFLLPSRKAAPPEAHGSGFRHPRKA